MGGRNDNSPACQRKLRPLSIIQENSDEESGPGDVTSVQNCKISEGSENVQASQTTKSVAQGQTNAVRKTRKVAIVPQQHPFNFLLQSESSEAHQRSSEIPDAIYKTNADDSGSDSATEGDLTRLKDTATKLNLKTRRPSYLTWRAKYVDRPRDPPEVKVLTGDGRLTAERKERMDNAIQWIQRELVDMKRQDQSLARQLLGIRHELSRLRLRVSCEEHQDLLDDAQEEMEELRELSRFADFPLDTLGANHLRQMGVTKMNLWSRRFSTC
ncbi:hypothetical protein BaRGS_00019592 [Batillaria attramentaria]|uniref:Uncharacterized protein n=1 Tax=Batillaria attramentaria TaxID=370345 RepID=A0ABD0KQ12_9CAEN